LFAKTNLDVPEWGQSQQVGFRCGLQTCGSKGHPRFALRQFLIVPSGSVSDALKMPVKMKQ
jgi:hypothetical protein